MNNLSAFETPPGSPSGKGSRTSNKTVSIYQDETTPQSTKTLASLKGISPVVTPTTTPVVSPTKKSLLRKITEAAGFASSTEETEEEVVVDLSPPSVVLPLRHVFYARSPYGESKLTFLREYKDYPDAYRAIISCNIDGVSYPLSDYSTSEKIDAWKKNLITTIGDKRSESGELINELFHFLHSERGLASQAMGFSRESYANQYERLVLSTRGSERQSCELRVESKLLEIHHTDHKDYFRCNFFPITGELEDVVLGGPNQGQDPLIKITFSNRYALGPLAKNDPHDLRRRLFTAALQSSREKTLQANYDSELVEIASCSQDEIKEKLKNLYKSDIALTYKSEFRMKCINEICAQIEAQIEEQVELEFGESLTPAQAQFTSVLDARIVNEFIEQDDAVVAENVVSASSNVNVLMEVVDPPGQPTLEEKEEQKKQFRENALRDFFKKKHKEQFDSALQYTIDETDSFSHEVLSHELIALMAGKGLELSASDDGNESDTIIRSSVHSLQNVTLDNIEYSPLLGSRMLSHTDFREFQDEDFEMMGEVPAWDKVLKMVNSTQSQPSFTVNDTAVLLAGAEDMKTPKRSGKIFFGANDVEVTPEYSQFATEMQDEIEASIFNEIFLLRYIAVHIEKNSSIWTRENKLGLCVTLLRYLEYPVSTGSKNAEYLKVVRAMLVDPASLNLEKLLVVTKYLIKQFLVHKHVVKKHYQNLKKYSPVMIWENVKKLLRETGFAEQLRTFANAESISDHELRKFATACENSLKEGVSVNVFQALLQDNNSKHDLVRNSIALMKQISDVCSRPYRANFNVTPTKEELEKKDDHDLLSHPFRAHYETNIEHAIQAVEQNLYQLESLNTCYTLLKCYSNFPHRQSVSDIIDHAIAVLKKPITVKKGDKTDKTVYRLCRDILKALENQLAKHFSPQELENLSIHLGDSLQKLSSRTMNFLVAQLNETIVKANGATASLGPEKMVQCFDKAYYLSYATKDFYINFDRMTDQHLEDIKTNSGGVSSDLYIQALIFRHFYISLSGYHLHNNHRYDGNSRKFFCDRFFNGSSEWIKAFQMLESINTIVSLVREAIIALQSRDPDALYSTTYVMRLAQSFLSKNVISDEMVREGVIASINSAIQKIGRDVDAELQGDRTPEKYIDEIANSLQSIDAAGQVTPFGLLSPKGQGILRVCAWMAALVNRYGVKQNVNGEESIDRKLDKKNILVIYTHIQNAWKDISGETPTLVQNTWQAYKELEILGEDAETECQGALLKKTPAAGSSSSQSITQQMPTQWFNDKGCYISSSQENVTLSANTKHFDELSVFTLQVTIWRHVAERFAKNIQPLINPNERPSSQTTMADSLKNGQQNKNQILKAGIAEIFVTLAFLYVDTTGTQLDRAAEVIECVEGVLSSTTRASTPSAKNNQFSPDASEKISTKLLRNIRKRLEVNPTLPAGHVVRAILFSKNELEIFRSKNFVKEIERRFLLPKPEPLALLPRGSIEFSEFIDVFSFLSSVKHGLEFVTEQMDEHQFFLCYMMEPFLTAFIITYAELFNTQHPMPATIVELFQDCIRAIEKLSRQQINSSHEEFPPFSPQEKKRMKLSEKNHYLSFTQAWWMIQENLFNKVQAKDITPIRLVTGNSAPQYKEKILDKKKLSADPYNLVLAYCVYAQLNVMPANFLSAMRFNGDLWEKISHFDLTPEIAKALRFILGPIPDCHLSPEVIARICASHERHLSEKQKRASLFFTHQEPTMFRGLSHPVEQVLLLGRVFCVLVSDQHRGLDQTVLDVMSIYRARLESLIKARNLLRQSLSVEDLKALKKFILETPLNYPVVWIFHKGSVVRCIEIYENNAEIVRRDCVANDSYLLAQAAIALPHDQQGIFEDIIRAHAFLNATIKMRMSLEFSKILLDLLHDSMALITRSFGATKVPITQGLISSRFRAYDDIVELQQCGSREITGLLLVALIYQVFATQEKLKPGSAERWLLNFWKFFSEPSNLRNLAKCGMKVVFEWWGTRDYNDPVEEKLQTLSSDLPPIDLNTSARDQQNEWCRWYRDHPNYNALSSSESRSSLAESGRSASSMSRVSPYGSDAGKGSPGTEGEYFIGKSAR